MVPTMSRSTKGASKQRRDLINGEISVLRDLLPLPEAARQRLSQLQIMSLACVYIRKCNFLSRLFDEPETYENLAHEFSQSLTGFLLVASRDGKLLYISENVTEYLGHSMVDMMTQGDSIYDIIDKRDHPLVQSQLIQSSFSQCADSDSKRDQKTFFCRMNVARSFRRQSGFGDHKMMHISGHFVTPAIQDHFGNQPVFMAMCMPLITPDVKDTVVQNSTETFYSVHGLDMKYSELGHIGQDQLGYSELEIMNKSWYELLHPEDILEAKDKHVQLIKSSHEMGCMLTIRLQHKLGHWVWTNIVMHIRQPFVCDNGEPTIVCINQVMDENQADLFKHQSKLYSSHIARSPEFLGSQGGGPQHTITQIPVEDSTLSQTYTSHNVESLYQDDYVQASTHGLHSRSRQNLIVPERSTPAVYSDSGSEYNSGSSSDTKQTVRADVIKRLKRKMSESSSSSCKPMKQARTDIGHQRGSPGFSATTGYQATAIITSMPFFGGSDFGMGGADIQVIAQGHDGPVYQQLLLNKNVVFNRNHGLLEVVKTSPKIVAAFPQPLTPDSLTSERISDFSSDMLTVDVLDTIPASILTPDASPMSYINEESMASPVPHTDPNMEYCANFPLLEDLTFFDEPNSKEKPKHRVVLELPLTDFQQLPVIDVMSLESMLKDLGNPEDTRRAMQQEVSARRPQTHDQTQKLDGDDLLNQVTSVLNEIFQNEANCISELIEHQESSNTILVTQSMMSGEHLGSSRPYSDMMSDSLNEELGFSFDEFQQLTSELEMPRSPFSECDLPSSLLSQNL